MNSRVLLGGRANPDLVQRIADLSGMAKGECIVETFPDDELKVHIRTPVRECHVLIVQSTSPPVASHALELLLLADACRRDGAASITGVVPYFGYARQDRRTREGEPVSARVLADILSTRLDRVIVVDLHTAAIEGFFSVPLDHVSAVPLLARELRSTRSEDQIIVAPDLGAVKLAQHYADFLELPVAYVHKVRTSGQEVNVRTVAGSVEGRAPLIVDDMISTGGTVVSAVEALLERGCRPEIMVCATHALLAGDAVTKMAALPIQRIVVTDSVGFDHAPSLPLAVVSIAELLVNTMTASCGI